MDYFTDVFVAFLDLDHVRILALVRELSDSIRNILISVPKMNEGLVGWNNMRVNK